MLNIYLVFTITSLQNYESVKRKKISYELICFYCLDM